ncbi:alpha-tocopherol transfer protein-like [Tropilaelaps mercedesae]|uniref:Alpha-tocopherol transfer protein-like n=1 Tax=Tropilaelaps mercedesae TaxID=418985 RepID=A0A1V9XCA5_9ACAR|nr:alpha-tocopherol transfer protein-like [Tropilaelaps mercedesae]
MSNIDIETLTNDGRACKQQLRILNFDDEFDKLLDFAPWQEKALVELGETPERRKTCLLEFRERVECIKEFKPCLDERFLLGFLRVRKFDVDRAMKSYKKFFKMRLLNPKKFCPMGEGTRDLREKFQLGVTTILPRRNPIDHTVVVIVRVGNWTPSTGYDLSDLVTPVFLGLLVYGLNDSSQFRPSLMLTVVPPRGQTHIVVVFHNGTTGLSTGCQVSAELFSTPQYQQTTSKATNRNAANSSSTLTPLSQHSKASLRPATVSDTEPLRRCLSAINNIQCFLQVHGIRFIIDMRGLHFAHLKSFPVSAIRALVYMVTDAFPLRFKGFHVFQDHVVFDYIFFMTKPFLSRKVQKRLHVHGTNIAALHEHICPSILPEEYGGEAGPFETDHWTSQMYKLHDTLVDFSYYGYDTREKI